MVVSSVGRNECKHDILTKKIAKKERQTYKEHLYLSFSDHSLDQRHKGEQPTFCQRSPSSNT